jgi:hypothetical protein
LVVIFIIGVLASLVVAGVIKLLSAGPELQNTNDIRQIDYAVQQFKGKYRQYPPSRVMLSADVNKIDATSQAYLSEIWPNLGWQDPTVTLDWAGLGLGRAALMDAKYTFVLEGDQCLVFFLGGVPDQHVPGCHGFSSNPKNPTDLATGTKESLYQFDSSRLVKRAGSMFYSYADAWQTGVPYVYFSSGKRKNGYTMDNPTLVPGGAYFEVGTNPPRYWNPTTFQIISAGKNGTFGRGGAWSPAAAATIAPAGADDQANFYESRLGVPK